MKAKTYTMSEKMWVYPAQAGNWHFITLTKVIGREIKAVWGSQARGFGSLPVTVTIGATTWTTSVFPDTYSGSYLLPIKAKVRKVEELEAGDLVKFSIVLL